MPCRVKSITDLTRRESVTSKQGQGPLTVLQGAPVSSILHAGACLKPLLHESARAAWLCCPGPAGSPVTSSHTQTLWRKSISYSYFSFSLSQLWFRLHDQHSLCYHYDLQTSQLLSFIYLASKNWPIHYYRCVEVGAISSCQTCSY